MSDIPFVLHIPLHEQALAHYGVKGMRWGVRREDVSTGYAPPKGVTISRDGSISIEKGAQIQRLVRSSGKSLPMKDITYASINDYDNAKYIKVIGGKGFFGGGRDQILSIEVTKPIKAPSIDEATRIVSEMMLKDPAFRKMNTTMLGEEISKGDLKRIEKDPAGSTARAMYEMTNQKMTFDKEFDPDAPAVQKAVREAMLAKGYNALRDENDVGARIAKAPIIIFNPQSTLKVKSVTDITDDLRAANKEKLKTYKKAGKGWVNREFYND